MTEYHEIPTKPSKPIDADSAPVLYCPVCGGAISLSSIPTDKDIEALKSAKPMPAMGESITFRPDSTTLLESWDKDFYL